MKECHQEKACHGEWAEAEATSKIGTNMKIEATSKKGEIDPSSKTEEIVLTNKTMEIDLSSKIEETDLSNKTEKKGNNADNITTLMRTEKIEEVSRTSSLVVEEAEAAKDLLSDPIEEELCAVAWVVLGDT
jgi:hypothetical protein